MVDWVRRAGRIWQGVFLAIADNLYIWRLIDEVDQKAATIALALSVTVRDLAKWGFTVCLIVTDNASKE
jgi:hypothetical protein